MNQRDAWIIRRLLTGMAETGDHEAATSEFRPIAAHLAELPLNERKATWDSFLNDRSDVREVTEALDMADPLGPAPEVDEDDGWGPIRLGTMPPAVPFPLEVLPSAAAELVWLAAASIGCPPDFVAVAMLAVVAGVVGRSVSLRLKQGYFASSCLYVACVGPPSNGKTPAFKVATLGVRRIGEMLAAEHRREMERWQEATKTEKGGTKSSPPQPRRIDIDDTTTEALVLRLAHNPRGLIMARDELTALLLSMNQYRGGKGGDRSIYLKIWSGDSITRDRVLDPSGIPTHCAHPSLSILGGLPPDMLGSLHDDKGSADGFADRFLFTYPDPVPIPGWSTRGIPDDAIDNWCGIVARLWSRGLRYDEGGDRPHTAYLTPEGGAAWMRLHNAHTAEMNAPGFPPALLGPWGKLKEYGGRLALILACLRHAADPTADHHSVPEVGRVEVENAWRLAEYFKSHARRAHLSIGLGRTIGGTRETRAIVDWLKEGNRARFSEHDLRQARRWIEPDALAEALAYLTDRNVVRRVEPPATTRKGGRPPLPAYEVNPALLVAQNT